MANTKEIQETNEKYPGYDEDYKCHVYDSSAKLEVQNRNLKTQSLISMNYSRQLRDFFDICLMQEVSILTSFQYS